MAICILRAVCLSGHVYTNQLCVFGAVAGVGVGEDGEH